MESLLLAATLLLSLGKAYDCNMENFFTGFSNPDSMSLSKLQQNTAKALDTLGQTEYWHTAVSLIGESKEMKDSALGLDKWLEQFDTVHAAGTTDPEKHTLLLAHVRELKKQYWARWHQLYFR